MENLNKLQILEKLYFKKEMSSLFQEIKNNDDDLSLYFIGKIYFSQGNFDKAAKIFEKTKNFCEAARCKLIINDIRGAKKLLQKNKEVSPLSDWLDILIRIIEEKVNRLPTFFEVRNFLEVDLSTLFEAGNINFAEKIVNSSEIFVQANSEANKFFARVLYNYNYIGLSRIFLDKSLDIYYNDPETHFLKAQCYIKENQKEEAKKHLNYCLECADNYFPARKLLKEIE